MNRKKEKSSHQAATTYFLIVRTKLKLPTMVVAMALMVTFYFILKSVALRWLHDSKTEEVHSQLSCGQREITVIIVVCVIVV